MTILDDYAALRDEKASLFKAEFNKLLRSYKRVERNTLFTNAKSVDGAVAALLVFIPQKSHPAWLTGLAACLRAVEVEHESGHRRPQNDISAVERLFDAVVRVKVAKFYGIMSADSMIALDFDQIYEEIADKHNVAELFDKLINAIQEIVKTGLIDSNTIKEGLQSIVAELETGKKGSFLAAMLSVFRSRVFFKHLGIRTLKSFKIADVVIGAVEDAERELDAGLKQTEKELKEICSVRGFEGIGSVDVIPVLQPKKEELENQKR